MLSLVRRWVRRHGTIVLTFHRVLTDSELQQTASLGGMIVRNRTFTAFLKYASKTCEFTDLAKEPDWKDGGKLKLAVTFDDGWSDNVDTAYPVACQYSVPMAIFIVPERTGTALPFWPERTAAALDRSPSADGSKRSAISIEKAIECLKELPAKERERRLVQMADTKDAFEPSAAVDRTMSWEQIAELHAGGVTFGSHTSTHEILTMIPLTDAEQEIVASREAIQQKLHVPCSLFSYPNGDYSERVRNIVEDAGYKLAFSNQEPGVWTSDCDQFCIPRVNVCEYHLVNSKGTFSSLIFEYAVVWNAAKGLLLQLLSKRVRKFRSQRQIPDKEWKPTEKKPMEKPP
jgi:peptidoglycan/xylan/chitin deacetylase (PgdA/CDA1 family)